MFCPFTVKGTCASLIFVECIIFHQINLIDDVHKVLDILTGHKLRFGHLFQHTPHTLTYSRSNIILTLKLSALKIF